MSDSAISTIESRLQLNLQQKLKLTPQQILSTRLLEMSSRELEEYVATAVLENPLLETSPADNDSLESEYIQLRRQAAWVDGGVRTADLGLLSELGTEDDMLSGLIPFLRDQLERRRLPSALRCAALYLAELVNEDGYLDVEDFEALPFSPSLRQEALAELRRLEPAGVGAFELKDCLLLQLERQGRTDSLAAAVIDYLPQLGQGQYRLIARYLHCSERDVRQAAEEIVNLEPRPGQAFAPATMPEYVHPDVFIAETEAGLQVVLNDSYLPRVQISDYYIRLLKSSDDDETRTYLRQKLQQARWMIDNLTHRAKTLQRCAEAILQHQTAFFAGETYELLPLSATELASELALHPSTVSRALRGKYLQCRQGLFPLRYFCSGVSTAGLSRQAAKLRLLHLVQQEDPCHPLSDPKLCALLEEGGIPLSRRTVTKYREALGIPALSLRRKKPE